MAKITLKEGLLHLVKNLDTNDLNNVKKIEQLLPRLEQAHIDPQNVAKADDQIQETIREKFASRKKLGDLVNQFKETKEAEYIVEKREFTDVAKVLVGKTVSIGSLIGRPEIHSPILREDGLHTYFDFIKVQQSVQIFHQGDSTPVMYATVSAPVILRPRQNQLSTSFQLTKGTIWIRANLFRPVATDNHYIGFKITAGTLNFNQGTLIQNEKITIPKTNIFSLNLTLDHSIPTIPLNGDHASDARESEVTLPKQLSISVGVRNMLNIKSNDPLLLKIYDRTYTFHTNGSSVSFDAENNRYRIPIENKGSTSFEIRNSKSNLFHPQGKTLITQSYWYLSSRVITNNQSTTLSYNGDIGLVLSNGLSTYWQGIHNSVHRAQLINPLIVANSFGFMINDHKTNYQQLEEFFTLWQRDDLEKSPKCTLTLSFSGKNMFLYTCEKQGNENISAQVDTDFQIDKPFQADGKSVSPNSKDTIYVKSVSPEGMQIALLDNDTLHETSLNNNWHTAVFVKQQEIKICQFAIENAFLSTTPTARIMLSASWDDNNHVHKGKLRLLYGLIDYSPILPHPYTTNKKLTNFYASDGLTLREVVANLIGTVESFCDWNEQESHDVLVDFKMNITKNKEKEYPYDTHHHLLEHNKGHKRRVNYPDVGSMDTLFDVSTHYDYWGVAISHYKHPTDSYETKQGKRDVILENTVEYIKPNEVNISNMKLQAPMAFVRGLTLPNVTWEPFINLTPPNSSEEVDLGIQNFHNNAFPSVFSQTDVKPVSIDPSAFMNRFQENLKQISINSDQSVLSSIHFSLPHGKISYTQLSRFNPQQATMNNKPYEFIRPIFEHQDIAGEQAQGSLQFRIAADQRSGTMPPLLRGWTEQLYHLTNGKSPIGGTVHSIFEGVFSHCNDIYNSQARGVPVTHLDFSGYGANTFSNWLNPEAKYADIAQVKFDVLNGRVAHEIVEAASVIYPWGIAVTRTISFYKRNNAIIYREDSGWVAKSDGLFDYTYRQNNQNKENPFNIHPGHIHGLFDVRNIKEISTDKIDLGNGSSVIGVSFDTDVAIEHVSHGATNNRVPGWDFKGYLQLSPTQQPIDDYSLHKLFMLKQNSIGGNVDCIMKIGDSLQSMHVKRVDMAATFSDNNEGNIAFIASPRGSVQLPENGSWSVVEIDKISGDVSPVKDNQSVPVYKKGLRDKTAANFVISQASNISRITSADALLNNNVQIAPVHYGFVQNTGTQKFLIPNPSYKKGTPKDLIADTSLLADSFTLMNSKGPFPNIFNAIKTEDIQGGVTEILTGGLRKAINKNIDDKLHIDIVGKSGDPFRMYAQYKAKDALTALTYITDSSVSKDTWKNEMKNLSIHVDMGPFKPIMSITGDFSAKPNFNAEIGSGKAPQLILPPVLQKVCDILEFLGSLDISDPKNNIEAIKKGLNIFMSNSADSWEYKFKAEKEIPLVKFPFDPINYNSPTTPLKLDAYFRMGCYFNMPIKIPNTIDQLKPSIGAFLELGADIRVMCVSLAAATIYATGRAEVGLAADLNTPPTLRFKFGFGVELCVGLPVIGSVAVTYLVAVDMSLNSASLKIGAFLYFRGRAEIFGGIVTVTISIEAGGLIERKSGTQETICIAQCTFGLDISIAWVINIEFTETWEERRQIA